MVFERFRKNSRGRDKAPPPPTAGTPSGEVPTGPSVVSCGDSSLSNETSVKNTPVYSPASPPQSPKAAAAVEPAYTRYGTYYPTPEEVLLYIILNYIYIKPRETFRSHRNFFYTYSIANS